MDSRSLEIGKPFPLSYLCLCLFEDVNQVVCVHLDVLVVFLHSRCFLVNWIRHGMFLRCVLGIHTHTQLILPFLHKVYIIDKTENNPLHVNNHPAWASEYTLSANMSEHMQTDRLQWNSTRRLRMIPTSARRRIEKKTTSQSSAKAPSYTTGAVG